MKRTLLLLLGLLATSAHSTVPVEAELGRNAFIIGMCETFVSSGDVYEMFEVKGKSTRDIWTESRQEALK